MKNDLNIDLKKVMKNEASFTINIKLGTVFKIKKYLFCKILELMGWILKRLNFVKEVKVDIA